MEGGLARARLSRPWVSALPTAISGLGCVLGRESSSFFSNVTNVNRETWTVSEVTGTEKKNRAEVGRGGTC